MSSITFSRSTDPLPIVPEPDFEDDSLYYWATPVKDSVNRVQSSVDSLASAISSVNAANRAAYGMLYMDDNTVAQGTIDTTPVQLSATSFLIGPTRNLTSNRTDAQLEISLAGVYDVNLGISFSGSASVGFLIYIYKNGVSTDIGFHRVIGTGGDIGVASCKGYVECASGDSLALYVAADSGSGREITAEDLQFCAHLIDIKE